jgi:hypothetical protein
MSNGSRRGASGPADPEAAMGIPEARLPGGLTSGPAALKVAARVVTDQLNGC